MNKKQKALEAQAKVLVKAQAVIAQKAKAERAREQRLNNEKFARWLDNASWSVRVFCTDSHVLAWAVGLTALLLVPSTAAFTIRTVVDESCFKSVPCSWALKTFVK
jgi:hypothetical protein